MVDRGACLGGSGDVSGVEVPPLPVLTLSQLVTGGRCGLAAGEVWASDKMCVGVARDGRSGGSGTAAGSAGPAALSRHCRAPGDPSGTPVVACATCQLNQRDVSA
jgi:hypothetical protein